MTEEFYPMPSFVTLAVADVARSTEWYRTVLGFRVVFSMAGPDGAPVLTHLRFSKYADLLVAAARSPVPPPRGAGVQLNFALHERSLDEFAAQARSHWAGVEGPVTQPWNARELYVTDPDGYRLAFVQQAAAGVTLDEVVERVRKPS